MQRKNLLAVSGIACLLFSLVPGIALSKTRPTWQLPSSAVQVDEHTYYLGSRQDPQSGKTVDGYAFLKHRNEQARGGNARKPGGGTVCYKYLAAGAKWKVEAEPWEMNPANSEGLDPTTLFTNLGADIAKWEDAADGTVNDVQGANILGNGTQTTLDYSASAGVLNGKNEVYFANASGSGVIAVTTVWGIFSGPSSQRELVEWDQVYDDTDFYWSLTGAAGAMDFENIATHELGHAVGMGHPKATCSQETMYAYANNGETLKRDLHTGDIAGINLLY